VDLLFRLSSLLRRVTVTPERYWTVCMAVIMMLMLRMMLRMMMQMKLSLEVPQALLMSCLRLQ